MIKEYHIENSFKSSWEKKILNWYKINKRDLPWRKKENQNFYRIWISEVMLQQTGVKTVIPYYIDFLKKWPTLESFFNAELTEILKVWQGLGYYQRAKNLYNAKDFLKKKHPLNTPESLKKIPGIGDYISSSICAILYNKPCAVIDSNIKRIITRAFALEVEEKNYNIVLKDIAQKLTPIKNNGKYCQSLMDLANLVCKPTEPKCTICPINNLCAKKTNNKTRVKIHLKKTKIGVAFFISYKDEFLVERSEKKLLQGLYNYPFSNFVELNDYDSKNNIVKNLISRWLKSFRLEKSYKNISFVEHEFSHFRLKLSIVDIKLKKRIFLSKYQWITKDEFDLLPISTLMIKIKEKTL